MSATYLAVDLKSSPGDYFETILQYSFQMKTISDITTMEILKEIKSIVRMDRNVWIVTIFNGAATEHRSFQNETDAVAFANDRVAQLRSGRDGIWVSSK